LHKGDPSRRSRPGGHAAAADGAQASHAAFDKRRRQVAQGNGPGDLLPASAVMLAHDVNGEDGRYPVIPASGAAHDGHWGAAHPSVRSRRAPGLDLGREPRFGIPAFAGQFPDHGTETQADVIVRNPTHFAVAIRYDAQKDPAPLVLAKGQDYLALKIIELGEANDVLIKEDKPLAQMLYKTIEVNDYIPPEMYQIVAELMAWVYNTKKKEFDIS